MTDMLTADKLMGALVGHRDSQRRAVLGAALPDNADAKVTRARSRERILLVHRTLARRRHRVLARRLP